MQGYLQLMGPVYREMWLTNRLRATRFGAGPLRLARSTLECPFWVFRAVLPPQLPGQVNLSAMGAARSFLAPSWA